MLDPRRQRRDLGVLDDAGLVLRILAQVGPVRPWVDGLALRAGVMRGAQLGHQPGLLGFKLHLAAAHGLQHDGFGRGAGLW
ncbi:hypothetical protein D3C85_1785260 [compost metagenome]